MPHCQPFHSHSCINLVVVLFFLSAACPAKGQTVIVEAEKFDSTGGWVLDHQAYGIIESSYLLAHGMGHPVEDASTTVAFDKTGRYDVYVSTYNWTAPWYDGEGPGAFRLLVDGEPLDTVLGVKGDRWGWQYAGSVRVRRGEVGLTLRDLTGFDGRVDAIVFTKEGEAPSDDYHAYRKVRDNLMGLLTPETHDGYDLVVAGGGIAGCTTALTAARYGLKVALVDNLPSLGGNAMLGIWSSGRAHKNLFPRLGYAACEVAGFDPKYKNSPEAYIDRGNVGDGRGDLADSTRICGLSYNHSGVSDEENAFILEEESRNRTAMLREALLEKAGVDIYHQIQIVGAKAASSRIESVCGRELASGRMHVFAAALFADCTGDGTVGYLSGADYLSGRESRSWGGEQLAPEVEDSIKMGSTMRWFAFRRDNAAIFPRPDQIPWALDVDKESCWNRPQWSTCLEVGMRQDAAVQTELIRDHYLRFVYGNWAYLRNYEPQYKDYDLVYLQHIAMKRESRRLVGDVILTANDIMEGREFEDASFTTTWPMDVHYANPQNAARYPGWEWNTANPRRDRHKPVGNYDVPYRCLYSRNMDNLFIGGRNMSVSHIALGTVRVQLTLGMAGEVTGMAAKICSTHSCTPRAVYTDHLSELKHLMEAGVPGYESYDCTINY